MYHQWLESNLTATLLSRPSLAATCDSTCDATYDATCDAYTTSNGSDHARRDGNMEPSFSTLGLFSSRESVFGAPNFHSSWPENINGEHHLRSDQWWVIDMKNYESEWFQKVYKSYITVTRCLEHIRMKRTTWTPIQEECQSIQALGHSKDYLGNGWRGMLEYWSRFCILELYHITTNITTYHFPGAISQSRQIMTCSFQCCAGAAAPLQQAQDSSSSSSSSGGSSSSSSDSSDSEVEVGICCARSDGSPNLVVKR